MWGNKFLKKPKVVFTFVEAGFGHISPMMGISKAFSEKYGNKCEIVNSYIFSDSKNPRVVKLGNSLSAHTKRTAFNKLYNRIEAFSYIIHSKIILKILDVVFLRARRQFFKEFKEIKPDLLVSSYYKPAHLAAQANKKGISDTLIATYTPDPYVYPAWDRNCSIFMVNNDWAQKSAIKKGFKQEKVKKTPFIYNDEFLNINYSKGVAREKLGIEEGRFVILVTNGAYGSNKTKKLIKEILKNDIDAMIICACGKDEKLLHFINQNKGEKENVIAIGYVEKLNDYMLASDLIVGKAGSNTLMETAYLAKPMIVCDMANRLEEIAAKLCQREGLAIVETRPKKIIGLIKDEKEGNTHFSRLKEVAKKYHDDSGASVAADHLYALLKTRFPAL